MSNRSVGFVLPVPPTVAFDLCREVAARGWEVLSVHETTVICREVDAARPVTARLTVRPQQDPAGGISFVRIEGSRPGWLGSRWLGGRRVQNRLGTLCIQIRLAAQRQAQKAA